MYTRLLQKLTSHTSRQRVLLLTSYQQANLQGSHRILHSFRPNSTSIKHNDDPGKQSKRSTPYYVKALLWAISVVTTAGLVEVSLDPFHRRVDSENKDEKAVESLDEASANCITLLRKEEQRGQFSVSLDHVIRFHSVQYPSNLPCEDEMTCAKAPGPKGTTWIYWGIFDGHAGGATSLLLKGSLIEHVSHDLAGLKAKDIDQSVVSTSIKKSFLDLDNHIIKAGLDDLHSSFPPDSAILKSALAPVYAGSCALLSMFDPSTSILRVACVGDSRAVLGRCTVPNESNHESPKYIAVPLSIDQTGYNPAEIQRINTEHPNEKDIINPASGRVLGMAISRAFGDARWKWSESDSEMATRKFKGPKILSLGPKGSVRTPPYLTAEPEITETRINWGRDCDNADFVIMGSDGFWDHISAEDAVECVAEWVKHGGHDGRLASQTGNLESAKVSRPGIGEEVTTESEIPRSSNGWASWIVKPKNFVFEEANAATHLVQNAFGGNQRKLFRGVMETERPMSRYVRDDISVYVVFFGSMHGKEIQADVPLAKVEGKTK